MWYKIDNEPQYKTKVSLKIKRQSSSKFYEKKKKKNQLSELCI